MKTLILRTFAHPNIWEGLKDRCYFEKDQKSQILLWEPNFKNLQINDIDNVIGIYTFKYFKGYKERGSGTNKIVNTASNEEKIISKLIITNPLNQSTFPIFKDDKIFILIQRESKLWNNPNEELMFKIDDLLVNAKRAELKEKHNPHANMKFPALAFTLDSNTVNEILKII